MRPAAANETTPTAKQIVFLFMAATVVAVVVFLCGVLVGRGVPTGGGPTPTGTSVGRLSIDLPPATLSSPRSEPSAAAGESAELTYYHRLDGSQAYPDVLRSTSADGSPGVETSAAPVLDGGDEPGDTPEPREADIAPATVDDQPPESEPSVSESPPVAQVTDGFSVQVMALRSLAAAQDAVTRLSAKGFPATVVPPEVGAPSALFRVRVGPYADRAEAQRIMRRLETEEQFEAFVTR
jgi:cell division septation protein DedD